METVGPLTVLAMAGIVYFFPSFIAHGREHHQRKAILVLNILLGWTAIGWIAALIWACTAVDQGKQPARS